MQLKPRSDSLELSANHHSSVQKPALAFEQRARHVDYTQAPSQITSLFPLRAKLSHGPQHESLTTVFTGCCSWDHRDTVWKGVRGGWHRKRDGKERGRQKEAGSRTVALSGGRRQDGQGVQDGSKAVWELYYSIVLRGRREREDGARNRRNYTWN